MDRIWQWAWDRHGARYSWAIWTVVVTGMLTVYVAMSAIVVAFEKSDHYAAAAAFSIAAVLVNAYISILPGSRLFRRTQWHAAGREVDRAEALADTYAWTRAAAVRASWFLPVWSAVFTTGIALIAGARGTRLVQYGVLGVGLGMAMALIGMHTSVQGAMRPARAALAGDTLIGDGLPRSHPTFAAWLSRAVVGALFAFTAVGAMLGVALDPAAKYPVLPALIAAVLTGMGWLITVSGVISPSLRPIRDLAEGTERVAAGDYTQRLPVVQDDDLGALAASFNRMQAGLAERQRLQAAFGMYVDPALAARLLEQGDDVFTGERREVTVMFVDVRDFTPFAEANSAEDTVARLNSLFEIVVPAVVDSGGHVNKFLGDGALAVFGAPNDLADHADAAVSAAVLIHRVVAERFGGALRIGIGINTGVVIAGTIGAAGHLEFTLIGDTTNVASRVEQLTKTTGDAILLTQQTVDALASRPAGLIDRGAHALKGKTATTRVFSLGPAVVN
jgi:class 3 adenylate cyclase